MKKNENLVPIENVLRDGDKVVEEFRLALVSLGLKIIEDINSKRVSKPEDTYNVLVSLYNAVKS